jgi:hypothetical protein
MRRAAAMLVAWGLWIGVWATTLAIWGEIPAATVAFGAAAASTALWAGYLVVAPRPLDPPRRLSETSAVPPLLAIGLLLVANGLAFGLWLILIGAEIMAFGAGIAIAERRRAGAE